MSIQHKKWASFEEMYLDLKENDSFKDEIKKTTIDQINKIIKEIEEAQNSQDFFNCTCKLSALFDGLEKDDKNDIYKKTNIYVIVLNAVLRNSIVIQNIKDILVVNKKVSELKKDDDTLKKLILINTALCLAFFGISLNHETINIHSIEFLRKNILDLNQLDFRSR